MATADFVIKAGDSNPILTDTLTLSDGSVPNFAGSTVSFVLRSLQQSAPVTLTGVASFTNVTTGAVQYAFSSADDANWGDYQGSWVVTGGSIGQMTFPTVGYLNVTIEQSLTTAPQQLVSVADAKEYLNISGPDRGQDAKLTRFIDSVRPVVEDIAGPIIPQTFEEWHDGGSDLLQLRRAPSTAFGTTPILQLLAASEYRGPIEYPLQIIASPVYGSIYSVFLNAEMGTLTRRTAGGRTIAFMPGRDNIHVIYEAGQSRVPPNVYEGTLELIRINYQRTQQASGSMSPYGHEGVDDEAELGPPGRPTGFLVPGRVRELLEPTKQFPSFA